jgi:glucose-6-phosphate isomerase
MLHDKKALESDFLGWVDLPIQYDKEQFERIKRPGERIQNYSDALIVIGIGGSYLGARAAIGALSYSFHNQIKNTT